VKLGAAGLTDARLGLAIAVVAIAVFAPALWASWLWDDHFFFDPPVPALASPLRFVEIFTHDLFGLSSMGGRQDTYRPLPVWLWSFIVPASGGAAWALHGLSLVLHGVASALCFRLARTLGAHTNGALLVAVAFACSTAQSEAVVWISGVHGVAETTFVLGTALVVLRAEGWRRLVGVGLCAAGALLCKESGALALVVAIVFGLARRPRKARDSVAVACVLGGVAIAYALWRRALALPVASVPPSLDGTLTMVAALGEALVLPPWPDVCRPLLEAPADALRGGAVLGVIVGLVVWRSRSRANAIAAIGCALAAVALYGPIAAQTGIASDRYLYLPLALVWAAIATAIPGIDATWRGKTAIAALAALLVLRGAAAAASVEDLSGDVAAFTVSVANHPDNPETHYHLGVALGREGRTDEAIASLGSALALRPEDPRAWSNLTGLLVNAGRNAEAMALVPPFDAARPPSAKAAFNLALAAVRAGDAVAAARLARRALELDAGHARAGVLLREVER